MSAVPPIEDVWRPTDADLDLLRVWVVQRAGETREGWSRAYGEVGKVHGLAVMLAVMGLAHGRYTDSVVDRT